MGPGSKQHYCGAGDTCVRPDRAGERQPVGGRQVPVYGDQAIGVALACGAMKQLERLHSAGSGVHGCTAGAELGGNSF